ncbi:hypothetical protein PV325_005004 [Microctonus aethiopoides]|nr:hypothetical protein PV325_005004 [Microctonus aethiopoides]
MWIRTMEIRNLKSKRERENARAFSQDRSVENVSLCVGALRALGADVGAVNPGELSTGTSLRPVLALLFALSRHKQRAKQLQDMPRLPSPYNKQSAGGVGPTGTSIPLPATVAATRRCPPDKVRPAPAPAHQTQLGKKRKVFSRESYNRKEGFISAHIKSTAFHDNCLEDKRSP